MADNINVNVYPRLTLKCKCGNEFNINVMRLRDNEPVICMICGKQFNSELGEKFAKALEDLYHVKYQLERDCYPFHFSFVYNTSYPQPPIPCAFEKFESTEDSRE